MTQNNFHLTEKSLWETPAVVTLALSATEAGEKREEAEERQTTEEGHKTYAPTSPCAIDQC